MTRASPRSASRAKVFEGWLAPVRTDNYCRPLPAGRAAPEPVDTSTSHVGFRCVIRNAASP
jgi:hypothetical protein